MEPPSWDERLAFIGSFTQALSAEQRADLDQYVAVGEEAVALDALTYYLGMASARLEYEQLLELSELGEHFGGSIEYMEDNLGVKLPPPLGRG